MARKAKKKSKANKVAKRVVKEATRPPAKKTKARRLRKKPHKTRTAKARKTKKKSRAEAAAIAMENMAYGLGYLIP